MTKVYDITPDQQDAIIRAEPVHEGFMQTLTFYNNMFHRLRGMFVWDFLAPYTQFRLEGAKVFVARAEIHDWGCGYGDGTALIKSMFPTCTVKGFDYASECIGIARDRWPHVDAFDVGDIRQADEKADVIFCSHTIEHMRFPADIIRRLRGLCRWLIVVVPPIDGTEDGGHEGAVPTTEWLEKVVPEPLERVDYYTLRVTRSPETPSVVEGNILLVMQGFR